MAKLKNREKVNLLNNKIYFLIFLIFIIFSFSIFYKNDFVNYFTYIIEKKSEKYGLTLKNVSVNKTKNLSKEYIEKYFQNHFNKSIFFLPLKAIQNKILENNWIQNLDLEIIYPSTVKVIILEKNPIGIYHTNNDYFLIDDKAQIIEKINNIKHRKLIVVYGIGSLNQLPKLINNLNYFKNLNVTSAQYVGSRRWDLFIEKKLKVKLPENNYLKALEDLCSVINELEEFDYNLIESVDLRIKEKAIIRFYNNDNINLLDSL